MVSIESDVTPFTLHVSDDDLADLKKRLELTRYPQELVLPTSEEWSYGTPVTVVKDLVEYWKTDFNWRKVEEDLNTKLPQFTSSVDTGEPTHGSIKLHFALRRSSRPNAIPLLFVHGWPGNFAEVIKMVDELTEPSFPKHPAFHVVSPSIPGHVFSDPDTKPGFGLKQTATTFNNLMKKLGYPHYLAQGGDWGYFTVRSLAIDHPDGCRGILGNMFVFDPKLLIRHPIMASKLILGLLGAPGGYSAAEMHNVKRTKAFVDTGLGYQLIQKEKPQTLGFGMTDSPAGLLAWLREKFEVWTDGYQWTNDELLMWTMLYWIPGPTPSFRFYKENINTADGEKHFQRIISEWSKVPLGMAIFKGEIIQFPDEFGSMLQPLVYVNRHDRGGHFTAWEVWEDVSDALAIGAYSPELLLEDIRAFAQIVVAKDMSLIRG